jgi:hypothetical protein
MIMPNIHLHSINIVSLSMYLPPPLKPKIVEVLPHHLLVSAAHLLRLGAPPPFGVFE